MTDLSQTALLIVGHGSTENPDSSIPYFEHAAAVRAKGIFAEVHLAFWKEEPSLREVLYQIEAEVVYVVPDFISEGYFTQDVIPRELGLDGPTTNTGGKTIHYCPPVGIHPTMTTILSQRVTEEAPGVRPADCTLFIVGHGTSLNDNTTRAVTDQAELLAKKFPDFAAVHATFMEQEMFIKDWDQHCETPVAIVVPFFIADGLHSYQDIPVLLGFEENEGLPASQKDIFRQNPYQLRGKTLYYTSAIGNEPAIGDVIIDQVLAFRESHGTEQEIVSPAHENHAARLAAAVAGGIDRIGEVAILKNDGGYLLCHLDDAASSDSVRKTKVLGSFRELREVNTLGRDGEFRFLKSMPNLPSGWSFPAKDAASLLRALDILYPAAVGLWLAEQDGTLVAQDFRPKLMRQTGMYRFAHTISDDGARKMIARECHPANCTKKIIWQLDDATPLDDCEAAAWPGKSSDTAIPLLCREACNHLVAVTRKVAKNEFEERETSNPALGQPLA